MVTVTIIYNDNREKTIPFTETMMGYIEARYQARQSFVNRVLINGRRIWV
jgi:hypothetical protein